MLVWCSWIALIWGALITLPMGIGVGVFASMLGGIFAVPLWGTVFGFLGMGSARTATLRQMHYKPLPPYDRLHEQAARYANQLDIPVPEVGSIPAFNAFAMGSGPRDATVAIGEAPPLSSAENTHARFMVRGRVSGLLNTHPSIDQRVRALEAETYLKRLPRRPS